MASLISLAVVHRIESFRVNLAFQRANHLREGVCSLGTLVMGVVEVLDDGFPGVQDMGPVYVMEPE
jgi:hypothetical protein